MKLLEDGINPIIATLPKNPFYAGDGGDDMIRLTLLELSARKM